MRKFVINVDGNTYNVEVEEVTNGQTPSPVAPAAAPVVPAAAPVAAAPAPAVAPAAAVPTDGTQVKAPMPGTILNVNVTVGQKVSEGDVLLILEAMKMENEIMAPCAGTVTALPASKGTNVDTGTLLAVIG